MPGKFHHETLYRGPDFAAKIAATPFVICGAGAIGSHLADSLARQGATQLKVIDKDRIDEHNVSTQLYAQAEVGGWKVDVLRQRLFRAAGVEIDAVRQELTSRNAAALLKDAGVVVDCFDNSAARQAVQDACRASNVPCLHVGLAADYCEVNWDEKYKVPADAGQDVCDYPLARHIILFSVAIAGETLLRFLQTGERQNWSATLGDFAIRSWEA